MADGQMSLFSLSRTAARSAGLTTYVGKVCTKCGGNIRFVHNCACVECNKARMRVWNKTNKEKAQQYKREHQPIATKQVRDWRAAHPEEHRVITKRCQDKRQQNGKRRAYELSRRYNLTPEQYAAMDTHQGYACAVCKTPWAPDEVPQVDHDHTTGVARGLLCGSCNRAIGLFKDSVTLLHEAIVYLEKHDESKTIPTPKA